MKRKIKEFIFKFFHRTAQKGEFNLENKKVFNRIGFGMVLILILSAITTTILPDNFPAIFKGLLREMVASYVGMYAIGLPLFFLIIKKLSKKSIERQQALSLKEMFQIFIVSYSGMLLINLIFTLIMSFFTDSHSNIVAEVTSQMSLIQVFFMVVIFAPIVEEFIFRELLYRLLASFGRKTYLFTSAMIFSLFHLNLNQSLYTFWLGIVWAGVFYKTGNILYPIILHMITNFIGSFVPLILLENHIASIIFSIFLLLISISGIIFFILYRNKRKNQVSIGIEKQRIPFKTIFINPGMIVLILIWILTNIVQLSL